MRGPYYDNWLLWWPRYSWVTIQLTPVSGIRILGSIKADTQVSPICASQFVDKFYCIYAYMHVHEEEFHIFLRLSKSFISKLLGNTELC